MVDTAFLWELFLQRLPSNVRIVLAFAGGTQSLEELADLADKVMDVPAPAVTQINTQFSSDVDQLCLEISDLKSLFESMHLPKPSFNCRPSKSLVVHPAQFHVKHNRPQISVGIITVLGRMPKIVNLRALGQETNSPELSGTHWWVFVWA